MILNPFSPEVIFNVVLLFCRVGTSFFMMPIFGEKNLPVLIRLAIAIAATIGIFGAFEGSMVDIPQNTLKSAIFIACEITSGLFIGLVCRIIISSIHTAGMSIGSSIGVSAAIMFDISQGDQSSIIGTFMNMIMIVLLLNMDLHLIFIKALSESYTNIPLGMFFKSNINMLEILVRALSQAWQIALQIASPFIISSLIVYVGAGILSRLMPQIQIFFLMLPMQIMLGLIILSLTLPALVNWYASRHYEQLSTFLGF